MGQGVIFTPPRPYYDRKTRPETVTEIFNIFFEFRKKIAIKLKSYGTHFPIKICQNELWSLKCYGYLIRKSLLSIYLHVNVFFSYSFSWLISGLD